MRARFPARIAAGETANRHPKEDRRMKRYKAMIAGELAPLLEGVEPEQLAGQIETPPDPAMGDLSLPCFRFAKTLRRSPQAIAEAWRQRLMLDAFERVEAVSGYLNFYFHRERFARDVLQAVSMEGTSYGSQTVGRGKTIVIDFSSPNIAKPFHVAHLRSTVIGNALRRIFAFLGYRCVGVNHLGDWGTQFGKLIVAYRAWGDPDAVEAGGIDELLRLYVKFHDEAEREPALEDEARAWFARMESGDEEALALWRRFVDVSMKEFRKMYDLLGVEFDSYAGESFYNDKMDAVVDELKAKGLLVEDQGAQLVKLDDYGMPPALILKKDGSSLYHTRDIAAALYRKAAYDFHKAIYVTDYAQNLHFKQWFKIVELMGREWAGDLEHVAFGRVSLEGMSLSTRKGNIVKLEDVLRQAIAKTKSIMEERNPGLPNKDEVARQVGVGAIVFNDLSGNRIKDISFSWEDALSFEGETGPYVQYAHARASSVLQKAAAKFGAAAEAPAAANRSYAALTDDASFRLIKEIASFGERVEWAMEKLEPSIVSRYLIDLAQAFNRFYHENPILVDDASAREARLALVGGAKQTLRNGLALIGLEAPESM